MSTRPRRMSNRTSGTLPVTRTATAMTLFVKTLAVSPTLLSPAGNKALVTRSSKRLIKPNPKFSRMGPSLSLNRPETTLHLVTTLLMLVGSCARSRTRSPATAAKAPMPTRRERFEHGVLRRYLGFNVE
ncbi:hypothetical protein C356_06484 [Cryptococcus neoformans c45]|nr:hypothetical protein C356_06484 [Cryptococcus neoformans var. grubii c45]